MPRFRVTNISPQAVYLRDFYKELSPGEVLDIVRTMAEWSAMTDILQEEAAGRITVSRTPISYELSSGFEPFPYDPTNPGDWPVVPGSLGTALDLLAAGAAAGDGDWQNAVLDRDIADPSLLVPVLGDRYIVAAGAVGAWAGHDNDIAEWDGAGWDFTTPTLQTVVGVRDEGAYLSWNGAAWGPLGGVTPTANEHLATKAYVDTFAKGLDWQDSVLDRDVTDPSLLVPALGDRYIVAVGGVGAWAGHDDDIAEWDGAGWDFTTPNKGFACNVEDEGRDVNFNGVAWVGMGTTLVHADLNGLGADDHPQYALRSALATTRVHVDQQKGDDATGVGSMALPYKTLGKALTELSALADDYRSLYVGPGVYEEGVGGEPAAFQVTCDKSLAVHLDNALIKCTVSGEFVWTQTAAAITHEPAFTMRGTGSGRASYPPAGNNYLRTGIQGNFRHSQETTLSRYARLELDAIGILAHPGPGVNGDIILENRLANAGILTHIFVHNGGSYTGDVLTPGDKCTFTPYFYGARSSGSASIGGAIGLIAPHTLQGVEITRPWIMTGAQAGGGSGEFYDVTFKAGSDWQLAGATPTYSCDANSYKSLVTNVLLKGVEGVGHNINRIDAASGIDDDSSLGTANVKEALEVLAGYAADGLVLVTVDSLGGGNFTTLNAAIDYVAARGGGVIEIIEDIHYYNSGGAAKDVSNITFKGRSSDITSGGGMIFWNAGAGAWTGENFGFENLALRGRPGASGSLWTAQRSCHVKLKNCVLINDGATGPTDLLDCAGQKVKFLLENCDMSFGLGPGARYIINNDSAAEIYAYNRSSVRCVTPAALYRDLGSSLLSGVPVADNVVGNHASRHRGGGADAIAEADGTNAGLYHAPVGGAWGSVPVAGLYDGRMYFDTGLKKPFFYNSGDGLWYDAAGASHP